MPHPGISIDEVKFIHRMAIEAFGGDPSERADTDDNINANIAGAEMSAYYRSGSQTGNVLHVAAELFFNFAKKRHSFVDGNKRVGWSVMDHYFRKNGLQIIAIFDDARSLADGVAIGTNTPDDIIEWLAANGRLVAYIPPVKEPLRDMDIG